MRLAPLTATLAALTILTACGGKGTDRADERPSAAGEVLGGDVTDDMLPLDTVRSVSPPDRSRPTGDAAADRGAQAGDEESLPEPEMSGGPEPRPAAEGDTGTPEPDPE